VTRSHLRAALSAVAFLATTGGLLPFYMAAMPFGARARRFFAWPFFRTCLYLTGISVWPLGPRSAGPGVLYVANHVSYLDIPVLALLNDAAFVAKTEVRVWPLFGFLAKISHTIFVSRQPANMRGEQTAIRGRLAAGESVFLFPEGSSSAGVGVLPFRPGLLAAACAPESAPVTVQPVSIVYGPQTADRPGLTRAERDRYAWYDHMKLLPHLWHLFGSPEKLTVAVQYHAPRRSDEFESSRALAQWAERTVAQGIRQIMLNVVRGQEETPCAKQFLERDFLF